MNCRSHLEPSAFSVSQICSLKDKLDFSSSHDFWPVFLFPTPPTSPVEFCNGCQDVTKEMRWHSGLGPLGELIEISEDELEVDELPFGDFPRELNGARAKSPAILNDIMWSGDRVKRPDSTTEFLAGFSLASTPLVCEQPTSHSFVESEELFACSLLTPSDDPEQTDEALSRLAFDLPVHEQSSDTDEDEIDVVGVTLDKLQSKTTSSESDTTMETENNSNTPPRKLRSRRSINEVSEQENEEGSARISHNDLERKRRNDLRNRFQCLRKCIPSLEDSERAAKITILRRASELIPTLRKEEERLIALKNSEKRRNAELLNTLMKLTKNKKKTIKKEN